MEKRVALYGFLVVLAVCWASLCVAEPRKITEGKELLRGGLSQILQRVRVGELRLAQMHGSQRPGIAT